MSKQQQSANDYVTIQIDRPTLIYVNAEAEGRFGREAGGLRDLSPDQALEALSPHLFSQAPDNGIEEKGDSFYHKVIAPGHNGREQTQPDSVLTFLQAMTEREFIVELVENKNLWDRLLRRRRVADRFAFSSKK